MSHPYSQGLAPPATSMQSMVAAPQQGIPPDGSAQRPLPQGAPQMTHAGAGGQMLHPTHPVSYPQVSAAAISQMQGTAPVYRAPVQQQRPGDWSQGPRTAIVAAPQPYVPGNPPGSSLRWTGAPHMTARPQGGAVMRQHPMPGGQQPLANPTSMVTGQPRAPQVAGSRPLVPEPHPQGGYPRPHPQQGLAVRAPGLQMSQQAYLQAASAQLQNFNGALYTYPGGTSLPQGSQGYVRAPVSGGYAYRPPQGSQMPLQRPPTSTPRPFVRGATPYPPQPGSGQYRPLKGPQGGVAKRPQDWPIPMSICVSDRKVRVDPDQAATPMYVLLRRWVQNDPRLFVPPKPLVSPVHYWPKQEEKETKPPKMLSDPRAHEDLLKSSKQHWRKVRRHHVAIRRRRLNPYRRRLAALIPEAPSGYPSPPSEGVGGQQVTDGAATPATRQQQGMDVAATPSPQQHPTTGVAMTPSPQQEPATATPPGPTSTSAPSHAPPPIQVHTGSDGTAPLGSTAPTAGGQGLPHLPGQQAGASGPQDGAPFSQGGLESSAPGAANGPPGVAGVKAEEHAVVQAAGGWEGNTTNTGSFLAANETLLE